MNGFWQAIVGGLAVAAFSGLTIVAYRHPPGYRRLYLPLVCAVWGVWAVWFIYDLGFALGFGQALLETMKLNSPTLIRIPSRDYTSWWYSVIPGVVYAYLSFLWFLPKLFTSERPNIRVK